MEGHVAHMVRNLVEEGVNPAKIIIFNRSGDVELARLIAAQRGCGWIDCSQLKMENLISPLNGGELDFENNLKAIFNPVFNETITQPLSFTPDHLKDRQPLKWIVQGKISEKSLNAIYGVSRAGKTFVALHLAAAIATGSAWLGNRTKKCPVLYLALESAEGFALRLDAYKSVHGPDSLNGLHVWTKRFSFADPDDVSLLIEHVRGGGFGGGIIFIDTLARAMLNWDENSATDMGKLIDVCRLISQETGCAIMLIAHAGKSQQAGIRVSISIQ